MINWDKYFPPIKMSEQAKANRDMMMRVVCTNYDPSPNRTNFPMKGRKIWDFCCPECRSQRVKELTDTTVNRGSHITITAVCDDCGSAWENIYTLAGYNNLNVTGLKFS